MTPKTTILGFTLIFGSLIFGSRVCGEDKPDSLAPIRTTAELRELRNGGKPTQRAIDLTALVISTIEFTAIVEDETGRAMICYGRTTNRPGEIVRIRGTTHVGKMLQLWDVPKDIAVVGHRKVPEPHIVSLDQLDPSRDDLKTVQIDCDVILSVKDEIDGRYQILIVKNGHETLPVYVQHGDCPEAASLSGARIRFTGVFFRQPNSYRFFQRPSVIAQKIEVLSPPPADPFDVTELTGSVNLTLGEINELVRCKINGRVLATHDDNRLMLDTVLNKPRFAKICFARLHEGVELPSVGSCVTLVGEVDADFFNLTFENARWKPAAAIEEDESESPKDIGPNDIFLKGSAERSRIDTTYQGALVRTTGRVLTIGTDARKLTLNCDGQPVPVDISSLPVNGPSLAVGTKLRVTGRCLLETSKTTNFSVFPQIRGFTIVVRTPNDIEILAQPPWWTPGRFLVAIIALLSVLAGLFIWNRFLNRLVQRRSKELAKAEIEKASSELRIAERTRLAVELHDSISQNLTGIALAINAGEMRLAERSLKSCREELRNCLWDLRSNALEEFDINEAIRKTLAPNLMSATLSVRFRLARNTISDTTAYAILRIIRELTVNGIRHGGATEINVAGSVEADRILFSVRDNGKGFDPEHVPSIDEGHFGLEGVRERISNLNGEMKIESSPGNGTKVTICLQKPKS